MTDTNPTESLDAEGMPTGEDHPPGRDIELDEESRMAPREYPVASGSDPAYPVTDAEQGSLESVAERAVRERPDLGGEEFDAGGEGVGGEDGQLEVGEPYVVGSFGASPAAVAAQAIPVDDVAAPPIEDEVADAGRMAADADGVGHPGSQSPGQDHEELGIPAEAAALHEDDGSPR
jgi:hypothetical protein